MNGRRFSLALLCAFAFCAFAAQSAVAQVGTQAVNTTAVTCAFLGGGEDFEGEHCDEKVPNGEGLFGHEPITNGTKTEMEVHLEGSVKSNGTTAGVNTEWICSKATSVAGKSIIDNVEVSEKHITTGTVQITLSECTVLKPSKCIITDVVFTADFQGVEGLNPGGSDMGIEFVGEGAEDTFADLTFHNKGAEKCSLTNGGKPFKLKGSAIATGKVGQGKKHGGATWIFEDANEMETLEVGLKKSSLTGTFTPTAAEGDPVALTTVT